MSTKKEGSNKKSNVINKGSWTAEEDRILAQYIEIHGPRRWKTVAFKAGLNRCGKSCRLRWLNYLRPNIKRGNISDAEEDLILRLHKLLGNRWALIAGRLPGRTDNEIKNYWNSHLRKKIKEMDNNKTQVLQVSSTPQETTTTSSPQNICIPQVPQQVVDQLETAKDSFGNSDNLDFDMNEFLDFSTEASYSLDWVNKFLELDHDDMWQLTDQKR